MTAELVDPATANRLAFEQAWTVYLFENRQATAGWHHRTREIERMEANQ